MITFVISNRFIQRIKGVSNHAREEIFT